MPVLLKSRASSEVMRPVECSPASEMSCRTKPDDARSQMKFCSAVSFGKKACVSQRVGSDNER